MSSIIPQYYYGGEEAHLSQRRCFPLWTRRRRTTTTRERSGCVVARKCARAKRPTPEHTPLFWSTTPRPSFLAAFPKPFVTKRVPKCNNAQSSSPEEKVVAMRTKPRDHRRRFARLDRFSFQNRNKNTASFFPIHRERGMCRGLLDSFCVANL